MPTRVRFRFNKLTGEVEEFTVDDQDRRLPEAEHDERARAVARMVAAHPRIEPIDDAGALHPPLRVEPTEVDTATRTEQVVAESGDE